MIHIIKDYYIDSDANYFVLAKWDGRRFDDGTPAPYTKLYYNSWENLTKGLESALIQEAIGEASCLGHLESICTGLRYDYSNAWKQPSAGYRRARHGRPSK